MTLEQFEAQFLDELAGMLYDATISDRTGREFAMWYRAQYQKLRATIRRMHAAMLKDEPPKPAVANSTATTKEKK